MIQSHLARSPACFELKSTALNLLSFTPKTTNLTELTTALQQKYGAQPDFFAGDPCLLDLSECPNAAAELDLPALLRLLHSLGLQAAGTRGADAALLPQLQQAGLVSLGTSVREVSPPPVQESSAKTLIIDKPVRSGQQIYARGADLVVLALVSHGAEVIADGHVHVYAPLRGRALAGARGDTSARIFTHCMEAELLSIAGVYRSLEEALPPSIKSRAAQVQLDGNKLVIEAMNLA